MKMCNRIAGALLIALAPLTAALAQTVSGISSGRTTVYDNATGLPLTYPSPLPVIEDNVLDGASYTDTIGSATVARTLPTDGYHSAMLTIPDNASSNAFVIEESNDNVYWFTPPYYRSDSNVIINANDTYGTLGNRQSYQVPVMGRYIRWRIGTYVGGTTTGILTLSKQTVQPYYSTGFHGANVAGQGGDMQVTPLAECDDSSTASVTEDRRSPLREDCTTRALVTVPYQTRLGASGAGWWKYVAASGGIVNTTTAVTLAAAPGTGLRNCISVIDVSSAASTTQVEVVLRDDASGTVVWRRLAPAAGSEYSHNFSPPLCITSNKLLEFATVTASAAGAVYVNAQGYVVP